MRLTAAELTDLQQALKRLKTDVDRMLLSLTIREYQGDLDGAAARLQATFGNSPDLVLRRVRSKAGASVLIAYLDVLVDPRVVDAAVIAPLETEPVTSVAQAASRVHVGEAERGEQWNELLRHLTRGYTLVFVDRDPSVLVVNTAKYPQRSVSRPETEATIRGPQESFVEALETQMGQLRRVLPEAALRFQPIQVGSARVVVAYLNDVAPPWLVETMCRRLEAIRARTLVNAAMVGGLVRDHPWSIFPTVRYTEHVDFAKWYLLQGRVVVLTDGDPFVLVAPTTLLDFYVTPMDYNTGWYDATFARFIRLAGLVVSLALPALYIVFSSVNPQLIPYQLLLVIMGSHAGLPFTPFTEAVIMIFMIEVIREATLRLPKALAGALGTMGAIVVGTAIVRSGVVSSQIIVVMTLTALSFFSVPTYELVGTVRLVNFALMAAGDVLGLFGLVLVALAVSGVLLSMTSFGVPYLAPVVPPQVRDWDDAFVRQPYVGLGHRPRWLDVVAERWIGNARRMPRLSR